MAMDIVNYANHPLHVIIRSDVMALNLLLQGIFMGC